MGADPILDPRRLGLLRDSGGLDGHRWEAFAAVARVASERLGAPVALVSLVDADRQVFAGQAGLSGQWRRAAETPLSHSFCQHVVRAGRALVVEDAETHPLVRDNLAIRDLGVRAYAGIPLRIVQQHPLGVLCVIDGAPRSWSPGELGTLAELAGTVESLLRPPAPEHDRLTGLLGPARLTARLDDALVARAPGAVVAALAVGVDDIAAVNDALGFRAGDQLLRDVAARVGQALGTPDVGRVGGDAFVAVYAGDAGLDVAGLARRIRDHVAAEPLTLAGETHRPVIRVGVAIAAGRADATAGALLERATRSLDDVRALGAQTRTAAAERLLGRAAGAARIREALDGALGRGELDVALEPDGDPETLTARVRWRSPALGAVATEAWLPVAEQTGAIVPIGEWALAEACSRFTAAGEVAADARLVVPVSATQLGPASFVAVVEAACADAGLRVGRLVLRLRPGALPLHRAGRDETLRRLAGMGVDVRLESRRGSRTA